MYRGFYFALFILVFMTTYDLCHKATRGFAIVNIYPTEYRNYETGIPKEGIDKIFSQSFHLFSNGGQSYVFISDDQNTILKLFKFQHHRIPPILEFIPLSGKALERKNQKKAYKRGQLFHAYDSYQNAFSYLKEESNLIEINLSNIRDRYQSKIKIFDAQNICYELDPNLTPFLLQKKVDLFETAIENDLLNHSYDHAFAAISHLLRVIAKRVNLGFADNDAFLIKNIGIDDDKAILIDVGTLESPKILKYEEKLHQIDIVCKPLFEKIKAVPELEKKVQNYFYSTIDPTLH
jgi:hypothetical protein